MIPRLVLDTNVWLDWLVFEDPATGPIRDAVVTRRAEVYADDAGEDELVRILARGFGKRSIVEQVQAACLDEFRRVARRIEAAASEAARSALPRCGDPDDQKFLEATLAAGAHYLISKDRKVLDLRRKPGLPFRIILPTEFPPA